MPIDFTITERLAGFAAAAATAGQPAQIIYRELVPPTAAIHLQDRLDRMHGALFSRIPDLPAPSAIDHILVVIHPDLSATAYVNELQPIATVRPARTITAGEPVRAEDIHDVSDVDLGVSVPEEGAIVILRSHQWRRSLFYDLGPLHEPPIPRDYDLSKTLAQQTLMLWGLVDPASISESEAGTQLDRMRAGLEELEQLLDSHSEEEGRYQALLQSNPWMLGGLYDDVIRHRNLDDERIPDFTGRRAYDHAHDVIEIKQPFLTLFRQRGGFTAAFNDAWNQGEGYLTFVQRQRGYLREEKGLLFDNPTCLLIIGVNLSAEERRAIREKEMVAPTMRVWTYDELFRTASHIVRLVESAGERIAEGVTTL